MIRFDTDEEYAWRHLENCMAICTDAIKEQKSGVERVTFVEYTLIEYQILIWVIHSHGTQEPSGSRSTSTLPSMYSVDIRSYFTYEVAVAKRPTEKENLTTWIKSIEFSDQSQNDRSPLDAAVLKSERSHAARFFETNIERLRGELDPKEYLKSLYKLLIKPIEIDDNLVKGEPLIFIPHEVCT